MCDDDVADRVATLEETVADLTETVEALADEIEATKTTANNALGKAIDVETEFDAAGDDDERVAMLEQEIAELQITLDELWGEVAADSGNIESWAAELVQNMIREAAANGRSTVAVHADDAHSRLDYEPDRTTIYDIFQRAEALTPDAIRYRDDDEPYRLQLDARRGQLPRTVGPHRLTMPDEFAAESVEALHNSPEGSEACGASTTTEEGDRGSQTGSATEIVSQTTR